VDHYFSKRARFEKKVTQIVRDNIMKKAIIVCLSLFTLLANAYASPQIPPDPSHWKVRVWIGPAVPDALYHVTVDSSGACSIYARDRKADAYEETKKLNEKRRKRIFQLAVQALSNLTLHNEPERSETEVELLISKRWYFDITIWIGNQRISFDTELIDNLEEYGALKELFEITVSLLPKHLQKEMIP